MASKRVADMQDNIALKKTKLDEDWGNQKSPIANLDSNQDEKSKLDEDLENPKSSIVVDGIANQGSKDIGKYHVILKLDIIRAHRSSKECLRALFSRLMEEVGSSGSQIGSKTHYSFAAKLTADQAKKMAGLECVHGVGRITPYRIDTRYY